MSTLHLFSLFFVFLTFNSGKANANDGCSIDGVLGRLSRGVNLDRLSLFPTDQDHHPTPNEAAFRQPLFTFSAQNTETWLQAKVCPSSDAQQRPVRRPGHLILDLLGYKMSRSLFIGFKKPADEAERLLAYRNVILQLSASPELAQFQKDFYLDNKTIIENSATVSLVKLTLRPGHTLPLSSAFREAIARCTQSYETDPRPYDALVESFGTHYFAQAHFGGLLYQKTSLNQSYIFWSNNTVVNENIELAFQRQLPPEYRKPSANNQTSLDPEFLRNSRTQFILYGGAKPQKVENTLQFFNSWTQSIPADPWIIAGDLRPIEELLPVGTLRENVQKARLWKHGRSIWREIERSFALGHFEQLVPTWADLQTGYREIEGNLTARGPESVSTVLERLTEAFSVTASVKAKQTIVDVNRNLVTELVDASRCQKSLIQACKGDQGLVDDLNETIEIMSGRNIDLKPESSLPAKSPSLGRGKRSAVDQLVFGYPIGVDRALAQRRKYADEREVNNGQSCLTEACRRCLMEAFPRLLGEGEICQTVTAKRRIFG